MTADGGEKQYLTFPLNNRSVWLRIVKPDKKLFSFCQNQPLNLNDSLVCPVGGNAVYAGKILTPKSDNNKIG
jgi:hypothetical protein